MVATDGTFESLGNLIYLGVIYLGLTPYSLIKFKELITR